jgi:tetratricopeptide (TPR) repeat protein
MPKNSHITGARVIRSRRNPVSKTANFGNTRKRGGADLAAYLGGLTHQLLFAVTQKSSYRLLPVYNSEASNLECEKAMACIKNQQTREAVQWFEKSLLHNPENTRARFAYARLLASMGRAVQAHQHYRLASRLEGYHSAKPNRKIYYLNPLHHNHAAGFNIEPSYAAQTLASPVRFPRTGLKLAMAACVLALLMFIAPASLVAAKNPAYDEEIKTARLTAKIIDQFNEDWTINQITANLYKGEIHPDSLIKTSKTHYRGQLTIEEIATNTKTTKLPEESYKAYPNPFDQEARIAIQLEERADITINLYNILAQRIWSTQIKDAYSGLHQETIPGQNLPEGIYLTEIITKNEKQTQKATTKLIKKKGAPNPDHTTPTLKKAQQTTNQTKYILELTGDQAQRTIIEDIKLTSGETTNLETIIVKIAPSRVKAKIKDQIGRVYKEPHKARVIAANQKKTLGETELTDGLIDMEVYFKGVANIRVEVEGPDIEGTYIKNKIGGFNKPTTIDFGPIIIPRAEPIETYDIDIGPVFDVETAWEGLTAKEPEKIAGLKIHLYSGGEKTTHETNQEGKLTINTSQLKENYIDTIIIANKNPNDTTWYEWKRTDIKWAEKITAYNDQRGIPLFKQETLPGQSPETNELYNKPPFNAPKEPMDLLKYLQHTRTLVWLVPPAQPVLTWNSMPHIEGSAPRWPDHLLPIKICVEKNYDGREPPNEKYLQGARDAIQAISTGRLQYEEVTNPQDANMTFDYYSSEFGRTDTEEEWIRNEDGTVIEVNVIKAFAMIRGPPTGELNDRRALGILIAHEILQPSTSNYSPYVEDNFYIDVGIKHGSGAPLESYRENRATKIQYDMANMVRFLDYNKKW